MKYLYQLVFSLLTVMLFPLCTFAAEGKEETIAVTDDSFGDSYGIGSISKIYTTAAVMKLSEEGKIDLDQPLVDYLPEFRMADERYVKITPRMLLNHTSGIMGTTMHDAFTFGESDTRYHDSILNKLSTQKLKAEPGEYGVYCNDGFTLAELLVEKVSGMSYSMFLRKNFFEPMDIQNTYTTVEGMDKSKIAPIYIGDSKLPYVDCHLIGSGGIYSTASDVAKFGQLFTGQREDLLSQASLQEMQESNSKNDAICYTEGDKQLNYGLGWDCVDTYPYSAYGLKAMTKGGSIIFQNSALVVLPKEHLSAAMIVSGGTGDDATYALQDMILTVLEEEGIISEQKDLQVKTENAADVLPLPKEMKSFAGYYIGNAIYKVSFSDTGTLVFENAEDKYQMKQEYAYIGEGNFAPLNGSYLSHTGEMTYNSNGNQGYGILRFSQEKNGKTYIIGNSYETIYGLGESANSMAFAEKIESQTIDAKTIEKWNHRDGRKYFLTSSVYHSFDYYMNGIIELQCNRELTGFIHADNMMKLAQIKDENHAVNEMDIPIMMGRDLATYDFVEGESGETLKLSSLTYVSEEAVSSIGELPKSVTMNRDEETKWYQIPKEYANKTLQIQVPKEGAYYLYDEDGKCVASSVTLKNYETVLLPAKGYLVLAGEKGNTFRTDIK